MSNLTQTPYVSMIAEHEYAQLVHRLAKNPAHILPDDFTIDIWHAATGIATEAGEVLDTAKKLAVYGQELTTLNKEGRTNVDNLIEELGDLEFYMEQLRARLLVTRAECLAANARKLLKRYPTGYSDVSAHIRADK